MITETATVVQVEGDNVTVSASVKTGCSQCQVSSDCGTSAVAKAFAPRQQTLTLRSPLPVRVGDDVMIGIPEQKMLMASWLVYVVPLLALIGSVVGLNQMTEWHELVIFLVGILFAWMSAKVVSHYILDKQNNRFEPVIVSKVNPPSRPV